MATAEELLNSISKNQVSVLSEDDGIFVIDGESRTITVPDSERLFGVEGDKDVERKYFQCPKIVGDNIDLSQHQIYVSYVFTTTENNTIFPTIGNGLYHCEDVKVSGDNITFSWLLSGNVFANPGFIAFKVMAKKSEGSELKTKWNTAPAIGTVLLTVPDGEEIAEEYPDIINQLLTKMESVEQIATPEAMQGYVNAYLEENPVTGGMTEEQEQQLNKNTEDISSLSEDISGITDTEKSINLFNVETIDVQMRLYSDTGKLQPQKNSGWISSDFIEIDSSRQYLITQQTVEYGRTTINITGRLCFYSSKSENGFISGLSNASTTFTNSVLRNAIPENTKYIKISLSLSNSEPASLELAKKCEIMIFEIPSDSTESIIPTPYVAFFEKKVVKTDKTLSKSNIPADAEVVGDKIEKLSDVIYNNKEEVDNKISNLIVTKTGYNLLNHVEKGKILNPTTGIVTDYAHFSTSDFIEITEGKGYVITQYYDNGINQRKNSAASRVCWYDTNKMYIGGSENVKAEYDTNVPITFPQNAKYIRVCFATTDLETMKYMLLEVYGTVYNTLYLPYLPYGYSENIPTKPKASFEEYRYLCFSFLNTVNQLNILGSDNLINFAPIKMSTFIASKLFTASKTKGGEKGVFASSVRDPAVIKYKEWYYIVYTVGSFYYDYNVIGMCRTKDFVDYEELDLIEVHCDFDTIRLWAPCWFRDIDEKTYITVSADDNGVFKTVIAEYNFDENTLGAGTVIIDDGGIDYHIFRHKGYYYAFGGNNKIRKSNTLLSLWGNNTIINTALPIGYEAHYPVVLDDGSLRLFRQELETNFEHAYMTYSDQTFDDIDNGKCGEVLYCRFNGNLQSEGEPIHMHWTIYDRFCRNGNNNNYIN